MLNVSYVSSKLEKKGNVVYMYTQWNIIQPQKRRKSCHMLNLDAFWGYYAKKNKLITKG